MHSFVELSHNSESERKRDTKAFGWDVYISAGFDLLMQFFIGPRRSSMANSTTEPSHSP